MLSILKISRLTKRFGTLEALSGISLELKPGMRVALLGHNGAGKSTMMKIILGLIPFDSGDVTVCGGAPGTPGARMQVAYLPENAAFHPALTGAEQVGHYLRLRGEDRNQAVALLSRVGLKEAAHRRIGTYSKGMRQRVGLAQALIGRPRLLILDEPTSGLDPVSRRDFYAILDELASEGASILLSSHALTEVEARTDRILILSRGRMMAEGSLADLRHKAALPIIIQVTPAEGQSARLKELLPEAAESPDGTLKLDCGQQEKLDTLARLTSMPGIADIDVIPPSLEDIYSHFSRRDGQ